MEQNNQIEILRPFGPSVAKVKIPEKLLNDLNEYIDEIILDEKKIAKQDHGSKLAGNVSQEFKLEEQFIMSSGLGKFLSNSVLNWLKFSGINDIKNFYLISSWIVRQFENEYNPIHWHNGHVSGVGYLKLPKTFGTTKQPHDKKNQNGKLELIHGSKQFLSNSSVKISPELGYFYFFPHYLMHGVYPFNNTDEERRSISFNAKIDEEKFNVYG